MAKPLPSAGELRCLFLYRADGRLIWRQRGMPGWDAKHAGVVVADNLSHKGYRKVSIWGAFVFQHRVVWKMHYDTDPPQVDHINGIRDDNRIENLRSASAWENARAVRKVGRLSGMKGVIRASRTNRFEARIKLNGKQRHLGTFDDVRDAAAAYDAEAMRLHGEFAITNRSLGLL